MPYKGLNNVLVIKTVLSDYTHASPSTVALSVHGFSRVCFPQPPQGLLHSVHSDQPRGDIIDSLIKSCESCL